MSDLETERESLQREVQPRLLVLDADPQVREIASTSLKDSGYHILFKGAPDRFEKVLLKNAHFDVILMDLSDPVERPFELLSIIKESSPRTEVIFISYLAEVPLWIESIQRGAYDYLPKPLNGQELRRVVRGALRKLGALPLGVAEPIARPAIG
jgi:DNA-binding NtrC family response regulator